MKILIIDPFPQNFLDDLANMPVKVTYMPNIHREEVLRLIPEYEILIINSKVNLDKELADTAIRLKMVIRAGVGMEHIDEEYLKSRGIVALNTKGGNADAVGEHAMGMLLGLQQRIIKADREVRNFNWIREKNRGIEIGGKTIGIIGYGNTGQAFARKAAGFEPVLIAYDKYVKGFGNDRVQEVGMAEIFEKSDIVTLHVPLTDETNRWVNQEFFNQFSKPIVLLNLARGPIVVMKDLLKAMDQGRVVAAGLDVFENEKIETLTLEQRRNYQDFFSRDNVVVMPHIGGWTFESLAKINYMIKAFIYAILED